MLIQLKTKIETCDKNLGLYFLPFSNEKYTYKLVIYKLSFWVVSLVILLFFVENMCFKAGDKKVLYEILIEIMQVMI